MGTKKIIYLILYLYLYIGVLLKYAYNFPFLTFLPDALIFYASVVTYFAERKKTKVKILMYSKIICFFYSLLIICSAISAILNYLNILSFLWGIRVLIRYALIVWLVSVSFNMSDIDKFKKILYQGFWINILFCILQYFQGEQGDAMTGTFTANGPLMLFCLIFFLVSVGDYYNKQIKKRTLYLVLAGLMLIAIWAEIKMMYFIFPLMFYLMYVLLKKFTLKLIVLFLFGIFSLIPTMKYFMSFYYDEEYVEQTFDMDYIEEETTHSYGFMEGGFNRSTAIEKTDEILLDTPLKKIVGNGLGSASASSFFSTGITSRYLYTLFWNFSTSYCLFEIGWLGFVIYCLFFFSIVVVFSRHYLKTKDWVIKYWASMGIISSLFTYILAWYDDNVYYKYTIMYFFWAVCAVAIEYRKKQLKLNF